MVINSSLGVSLPFPPGHVDALDVENIAYCYHAIVDRKFNWPSLHTTLFIEANKERFQQIKESIEPFPISLGPQPETRQIFDTAVELGMLKIDIERAMIESYDEVVGRMANLDAEQIPVVLRSLSGMIKVTSVNVPSLPALPWSRKLQELINLDSTLDELATERFLSLAVRSVDTISRDNLAVFADRPELDTEAFDF